MSTPDAGAVLDAAVPLPAATDAGLISPDLDEVPNPACDRGELGCQGSLIARCNARRSDFELIRDCRSPELCALAASRCASGACPKEELGCSLPELLPSTDGVLDVAMGLQFTCAVVTAGGVRCWGGNHRGQLGYGHVNKIGDDEFPASAGNIDVRGQVVQVAAGLGNTCALFTSGEVTCWGDAASGRLGSGDTARRVQLAESSGLTAHVGDDETPAAQGRLDLGGPVVQLAAGNYFTCALLSNGDVRCWGSNFGQLGYATGTRNQVVGDDEAPAAMPPVDLGGPAAFIAAGQSHVCAILRTGEVICWGRADEGRLGYGNFEDIGDDETPASAGKVALPERAVHLSGGERHTCAVLASGAVQCWGDGNDLQLGNDAPEIVGDNELPDTRSSLDLGARAVQVAAGLMHTCALLENGTVRCWGGNGRGQLGAGSVTTTPLSNTAPSVAIGGQAVKIEAYFNHTCAVLATRELICWGLGRNGNLGYGNTEDVGDTEVPASIGVVPVSRIPPPPPPLDAGSPPSDGSTTSAP
jgi:alpha-tubulin suppressor-like RCC1 family protein